jgi:hypothetical protein
VDETRELGLGLEKGCSFIVATTCDCDAGTICQNIKDSKYCQVKMKMT